MMWYINVLFSLKCCNILAAESTVKYFFFNREFPADKLEFIDNFHLVNASMSLKFLIHGWGESSECPYYSDFTREYLKLRDYEIVHVDWKLDASNPYVISVEKTKVVGEHIGNLILSLMETVDMPSSEFLNNIHLIGHSLGAHVAAHAGRTVMARIGSLIGRITGLDPAGPHFDVVSTERLNMSDASFVDVTHTDGNFFGLAIPIGHVDFYPNGGTRPQPGCELFNPAKYQRNPLQIGFCSHTRSYQFFIDSINQLPILAYRCDSYARFKNGLCMDQQQVVYGEFVERNATGKFFFDTQQIHTFAKVLWGTK